MEPVTPRSRGAAAVEIGAIAATFLAAIAVIHPHGNFPLNDDGYYALPTFEFARTGHFHMTLSPSSLRAQIIWGSLFVRAFGESYDALRLSTIAAALIAIACVNALLAMTPIPRFARVVATLAFAFHPLFIASSCTFMTEVHFICWSAVAALFYVRGLREDRAIFFWIAGAAVAASWFVRMTGILNAAPPIALLLFYRGRLAAKWKRDLAICVVPVVTFLLIAKLRIDWLIASRLEFGQFVHQWHEATFRLPQIIDVVHEYSMRTLQSTALMLLPVMIVVMFFLRRRIPLGAMTLVLVAFIMSSEGVIVPQYGDRWSGDVFMNFGLGPPTLDIVPQNTYPFQLPSGACSLLKLSVTMIAAFMLLALLIGAGERMDDAKRNVVFLFCLLDAGGHVAGLWSSAVFFDRYALVSAWPLVVAAAVLAPWDGARKRLAVIALVLIAAFDLAAVNEYFAWQNARWQAVDALRARGVPLTQVEAGAEPFTPRMAYITDIHERRRAVMLHPVLPYRISFRQWPGYRVIARHPFTSWLGLHRAEVLTMERLINEPHVVR